MPSRANYQKLAMLALAAQFRVREPFVQNQSGTFCLQCLLIIIHSLMDVFKRIATSLDPSSVNENTRKLQYNIFVYISSTVGVLWRFYAIVVERTNLHSPFITVLTFAFLKFDTVSAIFFWRKISLYTSCVKVKQHKYACCRLPGFSLPQTIQYLNLLFKEI